MLATSSLPLSLSFPPPAPPVTHVQEPNNHVQPSIPPGTETEQLKASKKTYLSLLPHAQIVELCLTFEQHVPLAQRRELWPVDLEAAILSLKTPLHDSPAPVDTSTSSAPLPAATAENATPTMSPLGVANVTSQQVHPPGSVFEFPLRPLDQSFPSPVTASSPFAESKDVPPPIIAQASSPIDPPRSSPQLELPAAAAASPAPLTTPDSPAAASSPVPPPTHEASASNSTDTEAQSHLPGQSQEQDQTHTDTQTPAAADTSTPPTQTQTPTPALSTDGTPQASTTVQAQPGAPPQMPGQPQPQLPIAPYPYAPYGYPPPQQPYPQTPVPPAAYPHAPYYPTPVSQGTSAAPAAYPSVYPGYPPYPPPAGYNIPPPPPPADDLPSYEDMLVEALMDMDEHEGAAPKDLYTWLARRWPVQTNFRPSASQALQKAYKRGRLEKLDNGKYRLNPNWEGGATSKRTTRRPQTLAQTTYAMHHPPPPPSSPFTHAPLARGSHAALPPPPQHQPYPGYAYPYAGYAGYPGYPPYPTPSSATTRTSTPAAGTNAAGPSTAAKTVPAADKGKAPAAAGDAQASSDEARDAWEAAQHILKAINFPSLLAGAVQEASAASTSTANPPTASAPAPPMASLEMDVDATGEDGLGRATLTDEERASLQAQLALLAAQLSEIAEFDLQTENAAAQAPAVPAAIAAPAESTQSTVQASMSMQVDAAPVSAPPVSATPFTPAPGPQRVIIDVNQFPDEHTLDDDTSMEFNLEAAVNNIAQLAVQTAQAEVAAEAGEEAEPEEDSDEDEDMEMVDVDSYMQQEGLRI